MAQATYLFCTICSSTCCVRLLRAEAESASVAYDGSVCFCLEPGVWATCHLLASTSTSSSCGLNEIGA